MRQQPQSFKILARDEAGAVVRDVRFSSLSRKRCESKASEVATREGIASVKVLTIFARLPARA